MARVKIDYGIDLGTTNSAISRMENGKPTIQKTDYNKGTMASCVYVNKKKAIQVGDSAYNALKNEKFKAMRNWNEDNVNAFIEFKRTMGTDKTYPSSNLGKDLTSEELSAEVLKTLKSFIKDESVNSIVITVPAAFKINQIDATRRAGKLAGFDHIEVLQEPVAAAMAYGLDSDKKDGFWLVFDFGGGTFDAALLKVEEGIMKVIDTEGDNYLGGKNLDFAIVDEIIIPYIKENFAIDSILEDDSKKQILRNAMKFYAEETKIKLSFNDTHNILSDLGDIPGEDDEGEEFELDITVTQDDITRALAPVFQKAINVSQDLLKRKNLKGNALDALILVGGPTFSPVLRGMLEKQICKPDTSADPMTVVSTGAALYASTVNVSEEVREQTRDKTKIQLEIAHESSTVEMEEYVPIKILADKTDGEIPEKVFVEITRGDKAWSSGKVEINTTGEVVEIQLSEGKTNVFDVVLYDDKGNILECEPNNFSVIQGFGGLSDMQTLPLHFGIEVKNRQNGKLEFITVKGLEKNKTLPSVGTENGLKTQNQIRPGMESDFILIPLYQGEHNSDKTRAVYNEHVYDVKISGNDLPALLPENSDLDLTISIDKSQKVTIQAYFPYLDHTSEIEVPIKNQSVETSWLREEFDKAKYDIQELKESGNDSKEILKAESKIEELSTSFNNNPEDLDTKLEVLSNLRTELKIIDKEKGNREWPELEKDIKDSFYKLEKINNENGNEKTTELVNQFREQLEQAIQNKDIKSGNSLLEEINSFAFELDRLRNIIGFVIYCNRSFDDIEWKNSNEARTIINEGMTVISETPTMDVVQPIVNRLVDLMINKSDGKGVESSSHVTR